MDASTLKHCTVPQLQQELKRRGLKKSGNKAALIERLLEACSHDEPEESALNKSVEKDNTDDVADSTSMNNIENNTENNDTRNIEIDEKENNLTEDKTERDITNSQRTVVAEEIAENVITQEKMETDEEQNNENEERRVIEIQQESINQEVHESNQDPPAIEMEEESVDEISSRNIEIQEQIDNRNLRHGLEVEEKSPIQEINGGDAITHQEELVEGNRLSPQNQDSADNMLSPQNQDSEDGVGSPKEHFDEDSKSSPERQVEENDRSPFEEQVNDDDISLHQQGAVSKLNQLSPEKEDEDISDKTGDVSKDTVVPLQRTPSIADVLHSADDEEVLDYDEVEDEDNDDDAKNEKEDIAEKVPEESKSEEVVMEEFEETAEKQIDMKISKPQKEAEVSDEGEIKDEEGPKVVKPKSKPIVPVSLRKNRVSLAGMSESAEERAARRKRRWGNSSIIEPSVTISGESMKKLIPDMKIDAADLTANDDGLEIVNKSVQSEDGPSPAKRTGRTVKLDGGKKVTLQKKSTDEVVNIESDNDVVEKTSVPDIPTEQVSTAQPVVVQSFEEFGERDRSPSPSRHPVTCFIHIANLVRPFTANNLKRLISRTCEIVENGFWMNNIKSNCYIQVGSLEQATETREALHGLKWPSGTPKTLEVEFVTNGRIYQETDGAIGKKEKVLIEIGEDEDTTAVHEQKKEIKKRPERRPSDHRRSREKKVEKRKPEAEKEESPAKLLDDLFRKTKATPCIYWLPLTDEQILEKENKRNNEPQRNESHRENRQTYRDRSSRPRYSPNRRQAHMSSGRSWR